MFLQKKILSIILILFTIQVNAQFFDLGQDPASVKWKIIKTEHFKIIYPTEIELQAQHTANMLEEVWKPLSVSLKSKPVKISVVLHNRSVTSNALVPWAPKRMEWYTNPSQDDYPQPWMDQLAVHEFRHVVQYSKINTGFTKILSYLFGQQITVGVMGAFVPLWFVEGDAVCTETAFSQSGRGRMPSFEMELRTQVLEKGIYNYNKAVFGSYKTYTPDSYILGYHIVGSVKKIFSGDVWESAMNRTARMPFMIVPFSSGVRKMTRLNKVQLYNLSLQTLKDQWRVQANNIDVTKQVLLSSKPNKFFSSYNHGCFMDDNTYLTVKSGMDDITRLISIDSSGKEKRLFTPGQYLPTSLSFSSNKIVWAETANDPRWEGRTYSVIKSYNILTHRTKQLTHRSRYFAPSLNQAGNKIVCVEQTIEGNSYFVILDAENGSVLNRVAAGTGDYIMTPAWSDDEKEIVSVVLNKSGKRIRIWNTAGEFRDLTQPSFVNIQQPKKSGSNVYFVGAWSGINNIYRLDSTGKIDKLTSSRFGVTDPSVSADGKEIIYSDYTADGYKLVKATIDSLPKVPLMNVVNTSVKLYESVARDNAPLDFYAAPETKYTPKPYHKFLHLLNFHSWGPLSIDADNTSIKPGLAISSQNLLGTMVASAGYEHNWSDDNQQFYAKISYREWYPQFDFSINYQMTRKDSFRTDIFSGQLNVKVPINLSGGKYYRSVQPQIAYSCAKYIPRNYQASEGSADYYQALTYRLYGYNMLKTSSRDINTRWGQMLDIRFGHTPFRGINLGTVFAAESMFYFPGIGRHHSFNFYAAYQQLNSDNFIFSDIIASPQGISLNGQRKLLTGKFNYELPLFYPDWSIFGALYIKRFRAAFHYDEAYVTYWDNKSEWANSAGLSLLSDFHFLRFVAPISLGCRTTYSFYDRRMLYELLYSINFNQLYFKPKFSRMND